MNNRFNRVVVAIHGVGNTDSGEMAKGLLSDFKAGPATSGSLTLDAHEYHYRTTLDQRTAIIEVNWTDLMKPSKTVYSILRHFFLLVTSAVDVVRSRYKNVVIGRYIIECFSFVMLALVPGTVLLSLMTLFAFATTEQTTQFLLTTVPIILILTWFTIKASKQNSLYKFGWFWIILMAIIFIYLLIWPRGINQVLLLSNHFRKWVQIIFVGFLTASCIVVLIREKTTLLRFSYLTLAIVPTIAINLFGTAVTLASLILARDLNLVKYKEWESLARDFVNYNLKDAELVTTIATCLIGAVPLVFLTIYFLTPRFKPTSNNTILNKKGRVAQIGLYTLVITVPILFLICLAGFIWSFSSKSDVYMLEVYKTSILRIIPFLGWFVPSIVVIMDVIGDILFYINDKPGYSTTISVECKKRLSNALKFATENADEVVVIAHSWGTVIAADVLTQFKEENNLRFITLGSPINALCMNFLNREFKFPTSVKSWVNAYRYGDYIAGPIKGSNNLDRVHNEIIGNGGHTNYWGNIGQVVT